MDETKLPSTDVERWAWYMDNAFRIPGTKIRFGWDAILGLIPGLGETVTLLAQCGIVMGAVTKYDVPGVVAARMVVNVLLDALIGSIPVIGDIFDVFFKANTRNMELLRTIQNERAIGVKPSTRRHAGFLLVVGLALLAIVGITLTLIFYILRWLTQVINDPGVLPTFSA